MRAINSIDASRPITFPARALAIAVVAAGLLALPSAGQAAVDFGSPMKNNPANSGECQLLVGGCTLVSYIVPTAIGDPDSTGAPVAGVITKFRIKAYGKDGLNPAAVTFKTAQISGATNGNPGAALSRIVGTGPTVTIKGTDDPNTNEPRIESFDGRVPVKKGDHLAIDGTDVQATYNNSGNEYTYLYAPPLGLGGGARGASDAKGELLVAATIEPDADGDGFGDETQDRCPTQKTTSGFCDTTKPKLSKLGITGGKKIAFRLAEKASVSLRIEKAAAGRKVGRKCVRPTRKNASKRRCTRYVKVKGLKVSGKAGVNRASLKRKLGKGRYRLVAVATDPAGNKSTTTKKFRVR